MGGITGSGYKAIAQECFNESYDAAFRVGKGGLTTVGGATTAVGIEIAGTVAAVLMGGGIAFHGLLETIKGSGTLVYAPIKCGFKTAAHTYSVITPSCVQEPLNALPEQLGRAAKAAVDSKPVEVLCRVPSQCQTAASAVLHSWPVQAALVRPVGAAYSTAGSLCSVVNQAAWETAAANILPVSLQGKSDSVARSQKHESYPERQRVLDYQVSWKYPFAKYAPHYFDAPSVLEGERKAGEGFIQSLEELKKALPDMPIEFTLEDFLTPGNRAIRGSCFGQIAMDGALPLNPRGRTGLAGRGVLPDWGPNYQGEPMVTRLNSETGKLEALLTKGEDGKWTLPSGLGKVAETLRDTVTRVLEDEMGIEFSHSDEFVTFPGEYVEDCRNTDNAWIEKQRVQCHLSPEATRRYNQPPRESCAWVLLEDLEGVSKDAALALSEIQVPNWM